MGMQKDLRPIWSAEMTTGGIDPVSEILGALKESRDQIIRRLDKQDQKLDKQDGKLDDLTNVASDAKTTGDRAMEWIDTRGEKTAQIVERFKWMIAGVSSVSLTFGAALVYYGGKILQVLHIVIP